MDNIMVTKLIETQNELENIIKNIAYANSDFVCTGCIRTIERLLAVYANISNDDAYNELKQDVNDIIGNGYFTF